MTNPSGRGRRPSPSRFPPGRRRAAAGGAHLHRKAGSLLALATAAVVAAGCGDSPRPFRVTTVTPDRAYTDGPVILRLDAGLVRPALHTDVSRASLEADLDSVRVMLFPEPADGRPAVRLDTLEWDSAVFAFWVKARPGLDKGNYTMELIDPRGHISRLPMAFEGLGPDLAPPTLTATEFQVQPFIAAGGEAVAHIVADDGDGGITRVEWTGPDSTVVNVCPGLEGLDPSGMRHTPPHEYTCLARISAPALDDADDASTQRFLFHATAWDASGQTTELEVPIFVARTPRIDSFTNVVGALGGNQPFSVRGRFFLPGTRVFIGRVPIVGAVSGGDRQSDQLISGWTPPHDRAEVTPVSLIAPGGEIESDVLFTYLGPPRPRAIEPTVGPASGKIRVTVRGNDLRSGVIVYVGATREGRKPLYNMRQEAETVFGCLPPGKGTVSVWTYDAITGDGELPDAFTYEDAAGGATVKPDDACM